MRFLRYFVALLALFALALRVAPARAAISVNTAEWSARSDDDEREKDLVNRKDCLGGAELKLGITVPGPFTDRSVETWVGDSCEKEDNRLASNKVCAKVSGGTTAESSMTITVKAADMVQALGSMTSTGECSLDTTTSVTRKIYFLLVQGSTVSDQGTWAFSFDLTAPPPPTEITVGPGEESLTVHWKAPENEQLVRYHFYCSKVAGSSAGTGGTAAEECASDTLKEGEDPPDDGDCGDVGSTGTTKGTTSSSLTNGIRYAVGVASEDKYGNIGVLSTIGCGIPAEVTGYYEAYRDAGGEAGGGFCSFSPPKRAAVPLALALALGAAMLLRRRR